MKDDKFNTNSISKFLKKSYLDDRKSLIKKLDERGLIDKIAKDTNYTATVLSDVQRDYITKKYNYTLGIKIKYKGILVFENEGKFLSTDVHCYRGGEVIRNSSLTNEEVRFILELRQRFASLIIDEYILKDDIYKFTKDIVFATLLELSDKEHQLSEQLRQVNAEMSECLQIMRGDFSSLDNNDETNNQDNHVKSL